MTEKQPQQITVLKEQLSSEMFRRTVDKAHWQLSWDKGHPPAVAKAKACLSSLLSDKPKGLILMGPQGCGKTALMALILQNYLGGCAEHIPEESHDPEQWLRGEANYAWLTHNDLIQQLRQGIDQEGFGRGLIPEWLKRWVLFIDDFGRAYEHPWNLALQDEFFDLMWRQGRPLVLSTNKSYKELRAWPGWERIVDRICDPAYSDIYSFGNNAKSKRNSEFYAKDRRA